MRCEVDCGLLAETLAVVVSTLPNRTTYPVLQNVMLEVADGSLAVAGTDLDTFVRKRLALGEKSEPGRALVPGRKLLEMARELGASEVLVYTRGASVHVEAGRNKATFAGLDPAEFPEMPKLPEGGEVELPIAAVLDQFGAVSFAVSRDDGRPVMCGMNWEVTKSEMRMVATDGHRLGLVRQKHKAAAGFKAIVAPKLFALLPRGQDKVTVHCDPGKLGMVTEDTLVIGRQIEGPYPDYNRVIPKNDKPSKAVLPIDDLSAAVRRALVFAHPVGRLTAFGFQAGKLRLEASTPELGSSSEDLDCDYSGKDVSIGFNAGYMLEILRHIDADKVRVELQGPLAAAVVVPEGDQPEIEQTYLLMPIRLE